MNEIIDKELTVTKKEMTYEAAMKRIEDIMSALDSEKLSLDDSIALYSESMQLIAFCDKKLSEAKDRITVITKNGEKDLAE